MTYFSKLPRFAMLAAVVMAAACGKESDVSGEDNGYTSPYSLDGLTVDGGFPIVAWTGINWNETHKFVAMKECGINTYLGWYDTFEHVSSALDAAQKHGVKLIVRSESFNANAAEEAAKMKNHPALLMYHIHDEPSENDFGWIAETAAAIRSVDTQHPYYVNLYPNWAWGGMDGYRSKLVAFLNAVPMRFLSFDNYPIREIEGVSSLRDDWYKNLEDIHYMSKVKKIPFWGFALALAHSTDEAKYPIPTVEELRVQQFSNLIYGCQGFQYFTYWGIYQNGPTQVYDRVQTVNKELQGLSRYFMAADIKNIWHAGTEIPYGTVKLTNMPDGVKSLSVNGNAIVSQFVKESSRYLALVNKDYKNTMKLQIEFHGNAKKLDKEGNFMNVSSASAFEIKPGDIILFEIL